MIYIIVISDWHKRIQIYIMLHINKVLFLYKYVKLINGKITISSGRLYENCLQYMY